MIAAGRDGPVFLEPCARRAAALDHRMRARLADSLRYLMSEAADSLGLPANTLDEFLLRLHSGPVAPLAFGAYYELVPAIENGEHDLARRLALEIAAAPAHPGGPQVVDLPGTGCRHHRLTDTDSDARVGMSAPHGDDSRACRALVDAAFALLESADPESAAETRTLLREIVLASGDSGPADAMTFDGASSFMLWGAFIVNVQTHADRLDMVQTIAHESTHTLLFGLCADGPLADNDDRERYASPLRPDARPMDGILHATCVCARVHRMLARLLDRGALAGDEAARASQAMAASAQGFHSGMEIIGRHARLTDLGRAVMAGARGCMRAACGDAAGLRA